MKVTIEKIDKYQPVTITFETQEEFSHLLTMLNVSGETIQKNYEGSNIPSSYLKLINDTMFSSIKNVAKNQYSAWSCQ